jgi:hypothetical protein
MYQSINIYFLKNDASNHNEKNMGTIHKTIYKIAGYLDMVTVH